MAETPTPNPYDLTQAIIDFESGTQNEEETLELFQNLVDTGLAWQLQGSYGRTANALIEQGLIIRPDDPQ